MYGKWTGYRVNLCLSHWQSLSLFFLQTHTILEYTKSVHYEPVIFTVQAQGVWIHKTVFNARTLILKVGGVLSAKSLLKVQITLS